MLGGHGPFTIANVGWRRAERSSIASSSDMTDHIRVSPGLVGRIKFKIASDWLSPTGNKRRHACEHCGQPILFAIQIFKASSHNGDGMWHKVREAPRFLVLSTVATHERTHLQDLYYCILMPDSQGTTCVHIANVKGIMHMPCVLFGLTQ
jgi:hypothetical protein